MTSWNVISYVISRERDAALRLLPPPPALPPGRELTRQQDVSRLGLMLFSPHCNITEEPRADSAL